MPKTFCNLLDILRFVAYIWAGGEAGLLAYLYYFGYYKIKPSKIVLYLALIFFFIAVFFFFLMFAPLIKGLDIEVYNELPYFFPVFVLPVAFCLYKFRASSTSVEKK